MKENLYCCDQFKKMLQYDEIISYSTPSQFFIYGKPDYAYDGDGHQDDMTEDYQIRFCPFCGTKL